MHLGCNLQLDGVMNDQSNDGSTREYHAVDTLNFVHEFCKIFGSTGTPEYGV